MSEDILVFADPEEVKKELAMTPPESVQVETGADPELEKQADAHVFDGVFGVGGRIAGGIHGQNLFDQSIRLFFEFGVGPGF
ncbi:MAG: hypothetical protein AAF736_18485, partial [Pseudomonadota bacterium]